VTTKATTAATGVAVNVTTAATGITTKPTAAGTGVVATGVAVATTGGIETGVIIGVTSGGAPVGVQTRLTSPTPLFSTTGTPSTTVVETVATPIHCPSGMVSVQVKKKYVFGE
jgi:hypothetical protein